MDFKKLQKEWAKAGGGGGGPLPTGGALKGIFGLLGLGAVGLGAAYSMYNVEGGHRAILFNRLLGIKNEVFAEGTHFKIPWFEWPIIYDVRSKPRNISSLTGSKDLQMVNVTLRVLSKPSIPHLPQLYEKLGTDFDERVLPSIVNEVLKGVVAQFNASQLITQREQVSSMIKDKLGERAKDFHILLDDVSITHLGFGPEYTAAVEAKQVAAQEAERARFVVEKALQDKRSTIIKAEGEAHAARLISDAIRDNPNFLKLRKLEAARDIANTLSKSSNRIFLSSDSLLLNIYEDDKHLAAGTKK